MYGNPKHHLLPKQEYSTLQGVFSQPCAAVVSQIAYNTAGQQVGFFEDPCWNGGSGAGRGEGLLLTTNLFILYISKNLCQ